MKIVRDTIIPRRTWYRWFPKPLTVLLFYDKNDKNVSLVEFVKQLGTNDAHIKCTVTHDSYLVYVNGIYVTSVPYLNSLTQMPIDEVKKIFKDVKNEILEEINKNWVIVI